MRILIRIVFVIFIENGIDCLGSDNCCDNCCDCFKEKKAESLVNKDWYNAKKENPVLMIFKKNNNDVFTSKVDGDKISFKLDEKDNSKIAYQDENENKLKLKNEKYALFEIKTKGKNTVYLYCSDVESSGKDNDFNGIFENMDHISISVIACDTEKVENMAWMLNKCNSLTELNLQNFDTKNVTNMKVMFGNCSSLENLNLNNFNTEKVTNMMCMFCRCSKLKNLDISNFNTEKVTNMKSMFFGCNSFPEDIRNKLDNVEEIINFFKGKNK